MNNPFISQEFDINNSINNPELNSLIRSIEKQLGKNNPQTSEIISSIKTAIEPPVKKRKKEKTKATGKILKRIFEEESIVIRPCDGETTFFGVKDFITKKLPPEFKLFNLNKRSKATPLTEVMAHEMRKDAIFKSIFDELNPNLNKLHLTQSQILDFVINETDRLKQNIGATFFLLKNNQKYFVIGIILDKNKEVIVGLKKLEDDFLWAAYHRNYIISKVA